MGIFDWLGDVAKSISEDLSEASDAVGLRFRCVTCGRPAIGVEVDLGDGGDVQCWRCIKEEMGL